MIHRAWPLIDRLVDTMADSALLDTADVSALRRQPRSGGLHMSTLLHRLCPAQSVDEIDERQLSVYGLMGLAFEDRAQLALSTLEQAPDWPYRAERPGEVDWYGVKGSPDVVLSPKPAYARTHSRRELSFKVKWRSSKDTPTNGEGVNGFSSRWDYEIRQCIAYSEPLQTRGAILCVYFVCGDWKPPLPFVRAWELDFEQSEVDETMNALATLATGLLVEDNQ